MELSRRAFLAGAGAALLAPGEAQAMGRTPLGGRLAFHVPWPTGALDPHDLRDPMAALFGAMVADPLFALDANGVPFAALANGMPSRENGETVVRLREGVRTARNVPLDGRDIIFSIERARAGGAYAVMGDVPKPLLRKGDPLAVVFGAADLQHLARTLASPLLTIVPRRFSPTSPDGTGAFRADVSAAGLVLSRNLLAARGAAFLDAIEVSAAEDLKTSLREFEAERDDLGWLGMGLHDGRRGAVRFDLGRAAWVVLLCGPDAGPAAMPGAAQRLADAIPPARLAHLGLGPLPPAAGDPAWPGPPADLLVDDASPHLVEVARAVVPVLSNPGHEVSLKPVPRAEIARRRERNAATLAVELVRPLGNGPHHVMMSLASAEGRARGRDVAKIPHHGPIVPARTLTGQLRAGVLGDVRVSGGVIPDVVLARSAGGEGWDLGASFRRVAGKA